MYTYGGRRQKSRTPRLLQIISGLIIYCAQIGGFFPKVGLGLVEDFLTPTSIHTRIHRHFQAVFPDAAFGLGMA